VGHACVTTGRRGFSMPTFFEEAQRTPHGKGASWSANLRPLPIFEQVF